MKSDSFKCKKPSQVDRDGEQVDYDTVYVRNIELTDEKKPHYKRTIYTISATGVNNKILRKVKGKTWGKLNEGEVVLDYGSIYDLGGASNKLPEHLTIVPAPGICNQLKYFKHHPKEDINMAYRFFMIAFWIGALSIILGMISILATIFEWKVYIP